MRAQLFRALVAPAEDQNPVPGTHVRRLTRQPAVPAPEDPIPSSCP